MTRSARGTSDKPGRNVRAKAGLNRTILAQSWGRIRNQLAYKAAWAGRQVVEVDPRFTSQDCSDCRERRARRCGDTSGRRGQTRYWPRTRRICGGGRPMSASAQVLFQELRGRQYETRSGHQGTLAVRKVRRGARSRHQRRDQLRQGRHDHPGLAKQRTDRRLSRKYTPPGARTTAGQPSM